MPVAFEDKNLILEKIATRPFGTNAYIITCRNTGEALLIDAPGEEEKISAALKGTEPRFILLTHSHMDHTGALLQLKSGLGIPVAIHPDDASSLPIPPDFTLSGGDEIRFGSISLAVLHTPGHTPGSLCFFTGDLLISGDTLFPGGPGKTRTPASFAQIVASLKDKIFVLPDSVRVFPGHGESTVLKKEKDGFAAFSSRDHSPNLCGDVLWISS